MKNTYFFMVLALFGCTTAPTTQTTGQISEGKIGHFENAIAEARESGIPYLAPQTFQKAERELELARSEKDATKVATHLSTGQHHLQAARAFAASSSTVLADLLVERGRAIQVFGQARDQNTLDIKSLTEQMSHAEERFLALTTFIEENKVPQAEKEKKSVEAEFSVFLIKALKSVTVDPALRIQNKAIEQGAEKFAPKTLALSKKEIQQVRRFIDKNPNKEKEIALEGEQALFLAHRTLTITKESRALEDKSPEETALWIEQQIGRISSLVTHDIRDKAFKEQVDRVQNSIVVLQSKERGLAQETSRLENKQQKLKSERAKLKSDLKKLNKKILADGEIIQRTRKFKQVKAVFENNEAEVITEGDNIVVRLRAIQFPIGKAVLLPDNYPLLSKVQKAIKLFDNPEITVEGHTDSVGSAAINKELSLKRAASVKDYLVANKTIQRRRVKIAGMGFAKPLTTDRTPEGRAINRRIDVIIHYSLK